MSSFLTCYSEHVELGRLRDYVVSRVRYSLLVDLRRVARSGRGDAFSNDRSTKKFDQQITIKGKDAREGGFDTVASRDTALRKAKPQSTMIEDSQDSGQCL